MYTTGIAEPDQAQPTVSAWNEDRITVSGGSSSDLFEVFDVQGRTLRSMALSSGTTILPCPSGVALWRITTSTHVRWNGRILVP
ncbi:MAG: hypothetical protein IPO05_17800 [Flavobacteriales bacterium]|nr:hypothetical protein [Flavobacteriales bacterium]